jgi:hypothetical protein
MDDKYIDGLRNKINHCKILLKDESFNEVFIKPFEDRLIEVGKSFSGTDVEIEELKAITYFFNYLDNLANTKIDD